jgi:hypothetical protein
VDATVGGHPGRKVHGGPRGGTRSAPRTATSPWSTAMAGSCRLSRSGAAGRGHTRRGHTASTRPSRLFPGRRAPSRPARPRPVPARVRRWRPCGTTPRRAAQGRGGPDVGRCRTRPGAGPLNPRSDAGARGRSGPRGRVGQRAGAVTTRHPRGRPSRRRGESWPGGWCTAGACVGRRGHHQDGRGYSRSSAGGGAGSRGRVLRSPRWPRAARRGHRPRGGRPSGGRRPARRPPLGCSSPRSSGA